MTSSLIGDAAIKTATQESMKQISATQPTSVNQGQIWQHPCHTPIRAVVYDILPPTTAIADYAIGLEKLSANEQFFNDAQTAVSL